MHFVQMWVVPDESGVAPGYEQLEIGDALLAGGPARRAGLTGAQNQLSRTSSGVRSIAASRSSMGPVFGSS